MGLELNNECHYYDQKDSYFMYYMSSLGKVSLESSLFQLTYFRGIPFYQPVMECGFGSMEPQNKPNDFAVVRNAMKG